MKISVIIPIHNELGNIDALFRAVLWMLSKERFDYEIIAVNDGSTDGSFGALEKLARNDNRIKIISFGANFGQTAAISAGIHNSSGDFIVLMDGDLENDPSDIPGLLKKLEEGYDVVSGWRMNRWKNKWLTRRLPSLCANLLISKITGLKLHDYGCTLKAYRREALFGIRLYGEMHRFIPAYASWRGARVAEMQVNYKPRSWGKSNYGISRAFSVILDLVVIKFLYQYMTRPIHFFGGLGFLSLTAGFIAGFASLALRLLNIKHIVETPLPILSALFIIVGVQLIVMGVIAEILMRTYYESQNKTPYHIKTKINFD